MDGEILSIMSTDAQMNNPQPKIEKKPSYFSLPDCILMAMLAALGVAVKAVVTPLAQIITGPLFIPGGAVAGGFYMLFLVLATSLTGKRGAALLTALVQAVLVTIGGVGGSHGAASLLTYTAPGLAVELVFLLLYRHRACCPLCCFLAGMCANLAGCLAVNLAIFRLSALPLLLALSVAALAGGLGGLIAHGVAKNLQKLGLARKWSKHESSQPQQ